MRNLNNCTITELLTLHHALEQRMSKGVTCPPNAYRMALHNVYRRVNRVGCLVAGESEWWWWVKRMESMRAYHNSQLHG